MARARPRTAALMLRAGAFFLLAGLRDPFVHNGEFLFQQARWWLRNTLVSRAMTEAAMGSDGRQRRTGRRC